MEGVSSEAASLAGNLRLGKLIAFYDDNHITIEGSTDLAFCERRRPPLRGVRLAGASAPATCNDLDGARRRRLEAALAETDRPSLLIVDARVIGYGSAEQGRHRRGARGAARPRRGSRRPRATWAGRYEEPFVVPDEVRKLYADEVLEPGACAPLRAWRRPLRRLRARPPRARRRVPAGGSRASCRSTGTQSHARSFEEALATRSRVGPRS